ncbi:hypothetical protein C1H46_031149 [Malus baccata]|uniref:Uncharacterized protein n=1 Tax=Malus baccata TaxID=106549 RepID=A0A540LAJ4_MALBA|nr:hypothetical protein C1H46_031149 [Malus baccata]
MQKESSFKLVRCRLVTMLCTILLVSPVTVFIFGFHISYPQSFLSFNTSISHDQIVLPHSLPADVSHLQIQLGLLSQQLHNESSESKVLVKFSDQVLRIAISLDKLADCIKKKHHPDKDEVSTVDEDFTNPEEGEAEAEEQVPGGTIFTSGEIRIYISPKQNR